MPRRLAAPDVDHGANAPPEQKLGDGDGHAHLALETVAGRDALGGVAIPPIEVFAIVSFHRSMDEFV
jgi:hypothetical protein